MKRVHGTSNYRRRFPFFGDPLGPSICSRAGNTRVLLLQTCGDLKAHRPSRNESNVREFLKTSTQSQACIGPFTVLAAKPRMALASANTHRVCCRALSGSSGHDPENQPAYSKSYRRAAIKCASIAWYCTPVTPRSVPSARLPGTVLWATTRSNSGSTVMYCPTAPNAL